MDLQAQRRRLLGMLRDLGERGAEERDSDKNLREYHHELSVFDNHPADVASEDYLRTLDAALWETEWRRLALIEQALIRLDRGEYEYCTECGGRISAARLEALPYTSTCADCADGSGELGGLGKATTGSSINEDVTWPRFNQYGTSDSVQDQPQEDKDQDRL